MQQELWQQVDWQYRPTKAGTRAFAKAFRIKMGKLKTLDAIGPGLALSKHYIAFEPGRSAFWAMGALVQHLIETYGLDIDMRDGALHSIDGEWSWALSEDASQAAKSIASLQQAAPSLEARPYVRNGESDTLGWVVFSSTEWAELDAGDLYAVRALFPVKGKVPKAPPKAKAAPGRRERDPEHAELLDWVSANKADMKPQLVQALDKLETSAPGSTEERDATSQIYRIGRRARRVG